MFVIFHMCITKMHMTLLWAFSSHWDWVLIASHSTFSTAETMCSTFFLLQVWFLSFIIIFLTYLDAFSVRFWLYNKSCSYVPPHFWSPKQYVAYPFGYGYDFIYFILVYQHIFNVSWVHSTPHSCAPSFPTQLKPKQCIACCFGSRSL